MNTRNGLIILILLLVGLATYPQLSPVKTPAAEPLTAGASASFSKGITHHYIISKTGIGTLLDPIRPEYTDGIVFSAVNLGDAFLVETTADLSGHKDIYTFPDNLDQPITAQDAAVSNRKQAGDTVNTYQEEIASIEAKALLDQKNNSEKHEK